jgi:hypothetical protein
MSGRRIRIQALAVLAAALTFGAADAVHAVDQYAYVVNKDSRDLTVINVSTRTVVGSWRTDRNPRDVTTSPDGTFVYVAANHDLTIIDIDFPTQRTDVEFQRGGLESTGVAVADGGRRVFVSQRISDTVTMIDLQDPTVATCVAMRTPDCNPGAGETPLPLPFSGGEHIATSPHDGAVFVVNADGRVARAVGPSWSFVEITSPLASNLPRSPAGMAIGPDGNVAISANANCPSSTGCIKVLSHPSFAITTLPHGFTRVGGVAIDTTTGLNGFPILVALPDDDAVGRITSTGLQRSFCYLCTDPLDVAFTRNYSSFIPTTFVTANAGHLRMPNVTTATLFYNGTRQEVTAGLTPVAVAIGHVLEGKLVPDVTPLSWVYSSLGQYVGRQRVRFTNVGYLYMSTYGLMVLGRDAANFTVTSDGCSSRVIGVGQYCDVEVDFRAGSYDPYVRSTTAAYRAELYLPTNTDFSLTRIPLRAEHFTTQLKTSPPVVRQTPIFGGGGE